MFTPFITPGILHLPIFSTFSIHTPTYSNHSMIGLLPGIHTSNPGALGLTLWTGAGEHTTIIVEESRRCLEGNHDWTIEIDLTHHCNLTAATHIATDICVVGETQTWHITLGYTLIII